MILKTVNASEFQGVRYSTKRKPKGDVKRKSKLQREVLEIVCSAT